MKKASLSPGWPFVGDRRALFVDRRRHRLRDGEVHQVAFLELRQPGLQGGSCTWIVRRPPCGPFNVTRLALLLMCQISAVMVVCRPIAPPGLAPLALRVAAVSVTTSGAPEPARRTSMATDS